MKRELSVPDFKEHDGPGRWRSYELQTEGSTLEECLANAVYWQIDQDGGEVGDEHADDEAAVEYITKWWSEGDLK